MATDRRMEHDPVFRNLVESIYHGMSDHVFTPTDVREALLMASIKIENERSR